MKTTVKDLKKFDLFGFKGQIELYKHIYLGDWKYCDLAKHYAIWTIPTAQIDKEVVIFGKAIEIPEDTEFGVYDWR